MGPVRSTAPMLDRGRTVLRAARRTDVPLLAAAIAFYALLSIVPLAVVGVAVAATVGGSGVLDPVVGAIDHLVTAEAVAVVRTGLEAEGGRSGATVAGVLVAVWGSLKVFRALDRAFDAIYGRPSRATLLETLRNAAAVVLAAGAIVAVLGAGIGGVLALGLALPSVLVPLALTPAIALVLVPLYTVFPPERQPLRAVTPGILVTAAGVTVTTAGLQLYFAIAAPYAVYGLLTGIFVAMTWLYAVASVILLGAVVNATDAGTDRQLHADPGTQVVAEDPMAPDDAGADDDAATLRSRLAELERTVEKRTLHRDDLEADLKRYVRERQRRGHARGWGPYVVLLYGVAMTVGAFYLLDGGWAVLAMLVIWLSTLGLYVLMLVTGAALGLAGLPARLVERVRGRR